MLRPCEYVDESPKDQLKPCLQILRGDLRNLRLFSDDELQLGNQIYDKLSVGPHGFAESLAPLAEIRVILGQKRSDETLKSLRQSRVRDVAFVLIEFAGRKQAARRNQRL